MDAMKEVVKSTQGEIKFVVTRKVPTGDTPREPPHAQWEMPPPPCLRTAPRRPPWTACEEAWGSAPPPERRLGLDAPLSPTRPAAELETTPQSASGDAIDIGDASEQHLNVEMYIRCEGILATRGTKTDSFVRIILIEDNLSAPPGGWGRGGSDPGTNPGGRRPPDERADRPDGSASRAWPPHERCRSQT